MQASYEDRWTLDLEEIPDSGERKRALVLCFFFVQAKQMSGSCSLTVLV